MRVRIVEASLLLGIISPLACIASAAQAQSSLIACADTAKPASRTVASWAALLSRGAEAIEWRDAIADIAASRRWTKAQCANLMRLKRDSSAMVTGGDYQQAAAVFDQAAAFGDVIRTIRTGRMAGKLEASDSDMQNLLEKARRITKDEPPTVLARQADQSRAAVVSLIAGDAYLAEDSHDKAMLYYQRALDLGLAGRADAQLKIGIAMMRKGAVADAAAQFARVAGDQNDKDIALLWSALAKARPR